MLTDYIISLILINLFRIFLIRIVILINFIELIDLKNLNYPSLALRYWLGREQSLHCKNIRISTDILWQIF